MKPENAIEVKNITKKFRVYKDKSVSLKEKILFKNRRAFVERNVINGISFSVKKGEAIGLIGHNGCGKSTTLKMLTRIMYPDSGTIEMCGRVSSLIELGAGFHPDMSGRQNIYINASIFGLSRKEIDKRLEDIIEFSELREFIDNPVRTYSSGMYMRLAFAVAINVDADILLIDEILAVGDANFQLKCFNRLREIKAAGTTIVLVSHSLGQIEEICERSLWIHDGVIRMDDAPKAVHPAYLDYMEKQRVEIQKKELERKEQSGHKEAEEHNEKIKITRVQLLDRDGNERETYGTGEQMTVRMEYAQEGEPESIIFGIDLYRYDRVHIYGTTTRNEKAEGDRIKKSGSAEVTLEKVELLPGDYFIDVFMESGDGDEKERCKGTVKFKMSSEAGDTGIVRMEHRWGME